MRGFAVFGVETQYVKGFASVKQIGADDWDLLNW